MPEVLHPRLRDVRLHDVMHALSDPNRLALLCEIAEASGEQPCAALLPQRLTPPQRSHHLRVLREAGITRTRAEGTSRYVSLRREEMDDRFPGLLDLVLLDLRTPTSNSTPATAAATRGASGP